MSDEELRAELRAVVVAHLEWPPETADELAAIAIRRWRAVGRRHRPRRDTPELRVTHLAKGLLERSPIDPLHMGPGDMARIAPELAEILRRHESAGTDG